MEDVDTQDLNEHDDEAIFLSHVIRDEHELLFLDSYIREALRGRGIHTAAGVSAGSSRFDEESTI